MKEVAYRVFFKAFSNSTRFAIIQLLCKGSKNVTEICEALNFEQSRVSHNLRCLENCGFVTAKWEGKNKVYALEKEILSILQSMDKHIVNFEKQLESCGILQEDKIMVEIR